MIAVTFIHLGLHQAALSLHTAYSGDATHKEGKENDSCK